MVSEIERSLLEFGDWGKSYPIQTSFTKNIIRTEVPSEIRSEGAQDFEQSVNDFKQNFDYTNCANPLEVLKEIQRTSAIKNDKDFKILMRFIKHRLKHSDPRGN